jgi:hypothetical protein
VRTLARARDKADLLRRLTRIRPDSERRWGQMSAHEMVCHLGDAYRMAMGQKPSRRAGSLAQRTIVKWIALYAPVRWPPGIPTTAEIDQRLDGTAPGEFDADMRDLLALVEQVTNPKRGFEFPAHPVFGALSERAWLRWAYLHMDHHLRQFGE